MYNVLYMATKVRKQIYLEVEQDRLLKRLSKRSGMAEAEIIRNAIDAGAGRAALSATRPQVWKSELAFIRRLMRKGTLHGGRAWQRDDLHDR
jgi:hypothetical protein